MPHKIRFQQRNKEFSIPIVSAPKSFYYYSNICKAYNQCMTESKKLFKKFSEENEHQLPFSLQYRWWDEVVVSDWEVLVYANQDEVFAIWPYHLRKRGPWNLLVQPHFTPYSGLFIRYPEGQKASSKISFQEKVYKKLIDDLPDFSEYKQNFHLAFENSLPFLWNGFEDQKRYTYVLDINAEPDSLIASFRDNNRKQIKKARKSLHLDSSFNSDLLKACFEGSFKSQGISSPIDDEAVFERILKYCQKYSCGIQLNAKDPEGISHASILVIWDKLQAYYLIGGSIAEHKGSGALSLLLWEGIQKAKALGIDQFNFEGSSIPAIEKYLRGFGAELTPFSCFYKNQSKSLNLARKIKG